MKKNKILLMASVACTFMFTSCSDLLDLYPEDSLSDPKFWTSVQDLELYANGFYGILPGAQGPGADDESDCYVNEKPKTWIFNLETIPTSGGGWGNGDWGNILTDVVKSNRWILGENENPNAEYPRLSYGGNSNNYRPSTYWLRNGSYLRLKNLEIGYNIPKSLINKIHLNNVRLYFMGTNLITFSNFKLWDPELGSTNGQAYPLSRSYTLGLTINI